jgi:hypothetical protein
MDLASIRSALKAEPFQPFELCLADGRRVPVRYPEFVAMNKRIVVIDEESGFRVLEPLSIVSLEHLPRVKKPGNGRKG